MPFTTKFWNNKNLLKTAVLKFNSLTRNRISFALLISGLILLTHCKKDPDAVGAKLIPENNLPGVLYSDTSSLITYSQRIDSVRTDETSVNIFGSMNDPVFGRTNASFSAQFRLLNENPQIGENPVIDSIILTLAYAGYYGDTLTPLNLSIYELSERIFKDSVYFSNKHFQNYGFDYADKYFMPEPTQGFIPEGDSLPRTPRLRIDLGQYTHELGEKILFADSAYLSDNENFVEYFKGLNFQTNVAAQGGSVLYFDLISSVTNLTIYYHTDTVNSTLPLIVNTNSARINQFEHNYETSTDMNFRKQVLADDTTPGQQKIYLQAMAGVKSAIKFPFIRNWLDNQSILVNEARLVLPVDQNNEYFQPAPQLGLIQINEDGTTSFLLDELEGPDYFGGSYDSLATTYSFRITRHIQWLMQGKYEDYGLSLFISSPGSNAYRTVIYGPEATEPLEGLKLELRYTEISN